MAKISTRSSARWMVLIAVAGAAGCFEWDDGTVSLLTDADVYAVGDPGEATLANDWTGDVFVPGCGYVTYQKWSEEAWSDQGTSLVCVWEGIAHPVEPGGAIVYDFIALGEGRWRLRVEAAIGCDAERPLSEETCLDVGEVLSNEFTVERPRPPTDCVVGGCSGEICATEPKDSICIWQPWFQCYRDAYCGNVGPEGACGWEMTPELRACLTRSGFPGPL